MAVRWFAGLVVAALVGAQPGLVAGPGIEGTAASITDYPWVVSLVDTNGFPFCDGALTSPTTVVTAAHCLIDRDAADVIVIGGRSDLSRLTARDSVSGVTGVAVPVTFVAPQSGSDIATLRLRTAFPYHPLPQAVGAYAPGTIGTVLGWSALGAAGDTTVLHEAQVPIVAEAVCARLFQRVTTGVAYDADAMFCAGGPGTGFCAGDAGGPLVVNGRLAGIASWSVGCGQYPDFYTKVSSYPDE